MKKIAIRFNWKGEKVVWHPIQTLIAIAIIIWISTTPMIIKNLINYIENNYEVDTKETYSVYDDTYIRITK